MRAHLFCTTMLTILSSNFDYLLVLKEQNFSKELKKQTFRSLLYIYGYYRPWKHKISLFEKNAFFYFTQNYNFPEMKLTALNKRNFSMNRIPNKGKKTKRRQIKWISVDLQLRSWGICREEIERTRPKIIGPNK